jgi:WD repeat-containing protein 70
MYQNSLILILKMEMEEMMRSMGLPTGFGVKKEKPKEVQSFNSVERVGGEKRKPTVQKPPVERKENDLEQQSDEKQDLHSSASDDSEPEPENLVDLIPSSYCSLSDHIRAVTSFSFDRACSRLVTGSRDNKVKLWDFNGMISTLKPFLEVEPAEGNPIRDVQFSNSGDSILVAPSTWQPVLFDRDGKEVCLYQKGDPYVRDLRHVRGHTSSVTAIQWHPNEKNLFMSSSLDSTIRVWDINRRDTCKLVWFNPTKQKHPCTAAHFSRDGKRIVSGFTDGQVCVWDTTGSSTKPLLKIDAHMKGSCITSTVFSMTGNHIITRAMDDTLKQWDVRNSTKPVGEAINLTCFHEEANAIYSPNERFILTGTGVMRNEGTASIKVYDTKTMELVDDIQTPTSCIKLQWHPTLNQLFAGLANGEVRVHFDPERSQGGVMIPLRKGVKKLAVDDYDLVMGEREILGDVFEPEPVVEQAYELAVPVPQWARDRNARKPALPFMLSGAGKGGAIGTNFTQHIMKQVIKNRVREEDPREALLKYAAIAESILNSCRRSILGYTSISKESKRSSSGQVCI